MKVALIILSGNAEYAASMLAGRFPGARISSLPRALLETGSMVQRLGNLRKESPDVFAVMTESLEWQFGQDALMLFGALAAARVSMILDSRGGIREGNRSKVLTRAPLRIARSIVRGKQAIRRAGQTLTRLEDETKTATRFLRRTSGKTEDGTSIAYLRATPAAGTQPGGATSHINGVVNALLNLGSAVSFISNDEILGLDKDRVLFQKIAPDPFIMPRSAFDVFNGMAFSTAVSDVIAASPPDLIYQRYSRFSWAGAEAGLRAGVPLFLEYNGSEVWIGKHWDKTEKLELLERCERLNLRAASRIFVISEVERNNLLAAGVPDEKIVVNPNGVDADKFRPDIGGQDLRQELNIPQDSILVGFVGTFGPWHGVLALADAIAIMPRDVNVHFLLVGDGSLRAEVERKLVESGDLDRVTFAGIVNHDRVPLFLDACDILVSPHVPLADGSDFFGSPTKLFEYMAMGKAIVASRLGQIGDVLENDLTAMLVEPGDPGELSVAIQTLANDRGLRTRLAAAARQAALAKHTWLINGQRVLDEFAALERSSE